MSDEMPDITAEDALDVAQRALKKANRVDELEERVRELEEETAALNLRLSELDEERDYTELSRDDKIGIVREELFRRATEGRGRTMDYTDVRDAVFDGEPSPAHCYDLMNWAADADGFEFRESDKKNDHLVVDPTKARRSSAFYSAKKDVAEGAV